MTASAIAALDIGGTRIDSDYHRALAWYRALRSLGGMYPVWRLHRLIGMGGYQVVTTVGGEELERRVCSRDLAAVNERGHRPVLASSAQQRHEEVFLDTLGARDSVDDWTTSADVESSEPAPDLRQVALKQLGAPPDASSVMVGDSVWDVEAAKRAGRPAIVVRSGGFGDDELRKAGAIALYDTPGDLAKALDATPLA
ncbi:HAD family hydrolase [Streptomyces capoamus]|uniref:HAD family hydrolase n=1 Tax=Streptomyces capoamus TaxID=68183 RepID=UPI0016738473|nr:HAD family hydrolase [Streptomyces capoamus]